MKSIPRQRTAANGVILCRLLTAEPSVIKQKHGDGLMADPLDLTLKCSFPAPENIFLYTNEETTNDSGF